MIGEFCVNAGMCINSALIFTTFVDFLDFLKFAA